MSPRVQSLPSHLQQYVASQDYSLYTAEDQAAWRYIMRQSRAFGQRHAHPIYLDGMVQTGVPISRIPRIAEMDAALEKMGWGAVAVRGFIPPAAFLELQARRVLPIAVDMRTRAHIAYTPAPDIVHEAAGHAPIIADPGYRAYLTRYSEMAQKAIYSREDLAVYEAIRELSDAKENPDYGPAAIAAAEANLAKQNAALSFSSEASLLARMYWWTAEYGLMGSLADPKIYGAGLLSSVGESQNAFHPSVRKIPLSVECVKVSFDITKPQPQLFVARDTDHLVAVLAELEQSMAFVRGGRYGLDRALEARATTTTVLNSGLAISGELAEVRYDADNRLSYLRCSGPCQLSHNQKELPGHGLTYHQQGYSTPLGRLRLLPNKDPAELTSADLQRLGVIPGQRAHLEYQSGITVSGNVASIDSVDGKLSVVRWLDCSMHDGAEQLFAPAWGSFDLIFASEVVSVYGGAADKELYHDRELGKQSTSPKRESPHSAEELGLFASYAKVRAFREQTKDRSATALAALCKEVQGHARASWLLCLEILELATALLGPNPRQPWLGPWLEAIEEHQTGDSEDRILLDRGLALCAIAD